MMIIRGRQDVEKLASELGIKVLHIKSKSHWRALGDPHKLDPDVIFLLDTGQTIDNGSDTPPFDASLKYDKFRISLYWNETTKAALRKLILEGDSDPRCIVCYEDDRQVNQCQQCNASLCFDCLVELGMTPQFQHRFKSNADYRFFMMIKCPECRVESIVDLRQLYHHIHLDRYDNFTKNVQRILISIKETDPKFEENYLRAKSAFDQFDDRKDAAKRFEKGCKVKLHGLKREEWNEQKAVIIGSKSIKSGAIRWPIQLSNEKKERAWLKPCNLMKLE